MKQYRNLMKTGKVIPAKPVSKEEVAPGNSAHTTDIIPLISKSDQGHRFTVAIHGKPVDEAHLIHDNKMGDPFAILKFKRYETGAPSTGDYHSVIILDNLDPNSKTSDFEHTVKDYIAKQEPMQLDRIYGNNQQTKKLLSFPIEAK